CNHLLIFIGTFLGVLLSLYLKNYQHNRRVRERLHIALENIISEIKENSKKTEIHLQKATYQLGAIDMIRPLINEKDSLLGTEVQVNKMIKEYPDFFSAKKRTPAGNGLYYWDASLNLNFDYLDLSDIAWRNAQAMDVLHLVDFKTANELYSLYNLQYQVLTDVKKAIDILKEIPVGNNNDESSIQLILQDYQRQLRIARDFEKGLSEYYMQILQQLNKKDFD
ncbi:MAG: hypothetical protein ACK4TA_26340, partial [Saprospiraceae bacterium]